MALPKPIKDVPRGRVPEVVETMLWSADVGDVFCSEQPDRRFTVVPRPRPPAPATLESLTRKKAKKKAAKKKKKKKKKAAKKAG